MHVFALWPYIVRENRQQSGYELAILAIQRSLNNIGWCNRLMMASNTIAHLAMQWDRICVDAVVV